MATMLVPATSRLGTAIRNDVGQGVDIPGRPRHEVTGAGALDDRERQAHGARHEVPHLGENRFGKDEGRTTREPREERLRQQTDDEDDELVDR